MNVYLHTQTQVEGNNQREGNSPSWFNVDECEVVARYVSRLVEDTRPPVAASKIGIINPYAKQAGKLRFVLRGSGLKVGVYGVMAGSTEIFQGQEKQVP